MTQSNPPAPAVPTDSPAPAPSDPLVPADPVPVSADPRLVLLGQLEIGRASCRERV